MVLNSIFKRFSPSVSMFAFRTTEQMRFSNIILVRDDLCQCLVSWQNLAFASPTYKRMKCEKAVFNCLCSLYTIQGLYIVPTHELVTRLHELYPVTLCMSTSEHFCMRIWHSTILNVCCTYIPYSTIDLSDYGNRRETVISFTIFPYDNWNYTDTISPVTFHLHHLPSSPSAHFCWHTDFSENQAPLI